MVLAIDTAFARCAVGLYDYGRDALAASREPEIGKGHAERLMGLTGEVLAEAGMTYRDLHRVAVTVGPGSFTGIRVGVAAARGFALSLAIPAVGITTLEALAFPHLAAGTRTLAVLDAKRGALYAALYRSDGARLVTPLATPPEALGSLLAPQLEDEELCLVGSGAAIAAAALRETGFGNPRIVDEGTAVPLLALGRLALTADPVPPIPVYLREADAKPQTPLTVLASDRPSGAPCGSRGEP